MILTNEFGLPEAFVKAMESDPYFKGFGVDYSVSELIAPVQQVILKQRHWDELKEDVMDGIWRLFGKAVHYILEQGAGKNELHEERLTLDILGKKVSGAFDLYTGMNKISDYKVTSAWSAVYGSRIQDWTAQLNLYAYLMKNHGYPVEEIETIPIYRDWSKSKAKSDSNYPQKPVERVALKLWQEDDQRKYLELKVKNLIIAENDPDHDLIPCSDEQMWAKPDVFAVMKEGRKSSMVNFDSMAEAEAFQTGLKPADKKISSVQLRPGKRTRCEEYCPVRDVCHQNLKYKIETGKMDHEEVEA